MRFEALETYTNIRRWAEEKGILYLIFRVAGLILVLLLFIVLAPLLAPYYAIKRICQRVKWVSSSIFTQFLSPELNTGSIAGPQVLPLRVPLPGALPRARDRRTGHPTGSGKAL